MADPMRIAVVGTSGSGKSTFSRRLGAVLDLPVIELDAINWQPGWRDINNDDPALFKARVAEAASAERWVCDGNYGKNALPIILARVTDIVWLDYPKALVMERVIRRSFGRAISGRELWPGTGNVERWSRWLDPGHPIRWAWATHAAYREEFDALTSALPPHIKVHRLRRPHEVDGLIARLAA